jgi:hypothetical protein
MPVSRRIRHTWHRYTKSILVAPEVPPVETGEDFLVVAANLFTFYWNDDTTVIEWA